MITDVSLMKTWPIIIAAITGALVGFLSTIYVGMAVGLATSLTRTATAFVVVVCPVIHSIWWAWWLVPILNSLVYGSLAFGIARWRTAASRRRRV